MLRVPMRRMRSEAARSRMLFSCYYFKLYETVRDCLELFLFEC